MLSPHAVLNGFVTVAEAVLVGSVVYADVPPGATAHGNPARVARLPA